MSRYRWIRSCAIVLAASACSSSHPPSGVSSRPDASIDASASTGGRNQEPGLPSLIGIDARTPSARADGAVLCAEEVSQAEQLKLDMLIAMDGSGSMGDAVDGGARKWDLVVAALNAFTSDPKSRGIGVGLTYFGAPDGYDAGDLVVSCDPADYSRAAVDVQVLPTNAAAIGASLAAYVPQGGTPTRPALEGVVQQAHAQGVLHPTHRLIIVLATDGEPNDCDSTVEAVANLAAAARQETPSVATYVIGVGSNLSAMDRVAEAGGTGRAYIVDPSLSTTTTFLAALNAIRGATALPCLYKLPPTSAEKPLDYDRVNLDYTAGTATDGRSVALLQVPDAAACDAATGGWYYDDSGTKRVALCASTCAVVENDPGGIVQLRVGCKTVKKPIR